MGTAQSYTSTKLGLRVRAREALSLYRLHRSPSESVTQWIDEFNCLKVRIESTYGIRIKERSVLDIGPGPFLAYSLLFAADENDVTAMDLDVIPVGLGLLQYVRMFRTNGAGRTMKTVIRKLVGIDKHYREEVSRQLNRQRLPIVKIKQGNVTSMPFCDDAFDAVHCRSVLQHIMSPGAALKEMARVVKPGGIGFVAIHAYTSHNGSLDPRVIAANGSADYYWAHLRPRLKETFHSNAILNCLRIPQWKELFSNLWHGCTIKMIDSSRPGVREAAEKLLASGELRGYTLEELLCHSIQVLWQKPEPTTAQAVQIP